MLRQDAQSAESRFAWIVQLTETIKSVPFAYPLRSYEKDESGTAGPVYSFPGRRDHHLRPCLPRMARDGRPAP